MIGDSECQEQEMVLIKFSFSADDFERNAQTLRL